MSVVFVEYKQAPRTVSGIVAKTIDGGFSLKPDNQSPEPENQEIISPSKYGTVPSHINVLESQTLKWKVFIDEPGTKSIDVSYSYQGEVGKGQFIVQTLQTEITADIQNTGLTVGEPNEDWHIECYKAKHIGKIEFPEAGMYEILLQIKPAKNEPVKFQWLWIK